MNTSRRQFTAQAVTLAGAVLLGPNILSAATFVEEASNSDNLKLTMGVK